MDPIAPFAAGLAARYRIDRELGRGGMATVFLARDLKHDRLVALKVLRPELGEVLGVERFLSEIRVTANLQHPNILPLFDSGEVNGLPYYAMPYVEDGSLRTRMNREEQLPIDDAVRIAVAIARALDYAHRHDIVHRDLKPENILLQDGQPLVADFGIALAISNAGGERLTHTGIMLGTPLYMSPEQASADQIDARSDIYSLGVVTYEMITGVLPHIGGSPLALISHRLTEKPQPLSAIRQSVPAHVQAAISCALEPIPADRFTHARDFADALLGKSDALPASATDPARVTFRHASKRRSIMSRSAVGGLATLAVVAAIGLIVRATTSREADARVSVSTLTEPRYRIATEHGFALSPDGSRVAYIVEKEGILSLWIRALDTLSGVELPSTVGARLPFWSPDGKRVGYFADGVLHARTLDTGDDRLLCPAPFAEGGSWGADDIIVFAPELRGAIHSVNAGGGDCAALTTLTDNQLDHRRPSFLPDGRHFIYGSGSGNAVFVGDVRTKEQRLVRRNIRYAMTANGYLLYVKDAALFAQPFDADAFTVSGEPKRILDGVSVDIGSRPLLSANATTLLVATEPATANTIRHVTIPASGSIDSTTVIESRIFARGLALSREGNRLAVASYNGLYFYDTDRGTRSQIASSDTSPQFGLVAWSPGDSLLAYNHFSGLDLGIRLLDVRRDTTWSLLTSPQNFMGPLDWSPDGRSLAFATTGGAGKTGLFLLNVTTHTVRPLVPRNVAFSGASFSPDGKWLVYGSAESGTLEIYVMPIASPGPAVQVTRDGGISPQWRGNEIYYVAPSRGVVAVTVTFGTRPRFSAPRFISRDPFFTAITLSQDARELYGSHATGERMLTVVENWATKAGR